MLKDKPMRICGEFVGEKGRRAIVYQDLVTREFIVDRTFDGFEGFSSSTYNNRYDNLQDAEDSAEDWVLVQ